MNRHIKLGLWSGLITGLLFCFAETIFLLFEVGSFWADKSFLFKGLLLYAFSGTLLGGITGYLLDLLFLKQVPWKEDKLRAFYLSLFFASALFLEIVVYLLDITFPPLSRDVTTVLYLLLTLSASGVLFFMLFKGLSFYKGKGGLYFSLSPLPLPLLIGVVGFLLYQMLFWMQKTTIKDLYAARSPGGVASASPIEGKPNILLILMDTTRADRFTSYGNPRNTTPHIDRFAREGKLFKNALSTSNWTLSSHASLFTGLYPSAHGTGYSDPFLMPNIPVLSEILSKNGYRTLSLYDNALVGKLTLLDRGFDKAIGLEIDQKTALTLERLWERVLHNDVGVKAPRTVDMALKWIEASKDSGLPYFAFVHFNDVHLPYTPRKPYIDEFLKEVDMKQVHLSNVRKVNSQIAFSKYVDGSIDLSPSDFNYLKALYDSEIRYVDELIERLVSTLERRGDLKNTLVIITADHGENLGEHKLMSHRHSLYNTVLHIPLILWYPGKIQAGVEEAEVSLVDILPTVLSFTGLEDQIPEGVQGINILASKIPSRNVFAQSRGWAKMFQEDAKGWASSDISNNAEAIFDENWKFIWSATGNHGLYDLSRDPQELKNLVEEFPEKADELKAKLDAWLTSSRAYTVVRNKLKKEEEEKKLKAALKSMGYLQ